MLGLSRLGYSLALNRQVPSLVGRLHPTYSTPVVIIAAGALLALALIVPGDLEFLAGIYAFGATLAFTIVHLVGHARCAIASPTATGRTRCRSTSGSAAASCRCPPCWARSSSGASFAAVLVLHSGARFLGVGWMAVGIALYVVYRRSNGKPVLQARHDPGARARRARRPRPSTDRSSCPSSARRSTTTSCRPPGGCRPRSARTRGGRRGDRGAVGLRGAAGAADRRARPGRRAQARARGARARQGGGGGVRGRRGGDRDRPRAARRARRSSTRPGAAAWRRSCSPRRSRRASAAGRCSAAAAGVAARRLRRRHDPLRRQQGAVPGDPDRAARALAVR